MSEIERRNKETHDYHSHDQGEAVRGVYPGEASRQSPTIRGLIEHNKRIQPTFGRFDLSLTDDSHDIIIESDHEPKRFLITQTNKKSDALGEKLENQGIPQLDKVFYNDDETVYSVPSNAKPLLNEKLYPGKESSPTYISDAELFEKVGNFWRKIYTITGSLPEQTILKHTGMVEFTDKGEKLFPIPPYSSWIEGLSPHQAAGLFENSVRSELMSNQPDMSIDDLIITASRAFKEQ